jgi:NTE family protein
MTTGGGARARRRAVRRRMIPDAARAGAAYRLPSPAGRPRAGEGGRWGLVLGGGGVLGAAWLVGALDALQQARGVDARDAEIILGTSAGSVIGGLLAGGVPVEELMAQQRGEYDAGRAPMPREDYEAPAGPPMPPRPALRPGNARIITRNARRLRRMPPTTVLSGFVPAGRGSMPAVGRLIETVVPAGSWADHPGLRIVAVDYDSGRRVAFGAPGTPAAGLAQAVLASCAIPGWFAPVEIDGVRYVDGGVWSATNADLLAGQDLDEVIVLAPMFSVRYDRPADLRARVERRWRARVTRRAMAEAAKVNRGGAAVTVLGPGPEDLQLIGYNLMAPDRRAPVLETSRRTSLAALQAPVTAGDGAATAPAPAQEAEATAAADPSAADLDRPVIDLDAAEQTRLVDLDAVAHDQAAADEPAAEEPAAESHGERR